MDTCFAIPGQFLLMYSFIVSRACLYGNASTRGILDLRIRCQHVRRDLDSSMEH